MQPIETLEPVEGDSKSLFEFAARAQRFLLKHHWCRRIIRGHLDRGWEGVLAVFCFEIEPASPEVDRTIWVIEGDVPSAYICSDNESGAEALVGYVDEMQKWVDAVQAGRSIEGVIPVNAPATQEYADMLASRLQFIRNNLLPVYDDAPEA